MSVGSVRTPRGEPTRRKDAMQKGEKTKKRNAKRRNDEITTCKRRNPPCKKTKFQSEKTEKKTPCEKTPFETFILSSFRVASFAWRLLV